MSASSSMAIGSLTTGGNSVRNGFGRSNTATTSAAAASTSAPAAKAPSLFQSCHQIGTTVRALADPDGDCPFLAFVSTCRPDDSAVASVASAEAYRDALAGSALGSRDSAGERCREDEMGRFRAAEVPIPRRNASSLVFSTVGEPTVAAAPSRNGSSASVTSAIVW